jgi:hypothetical protein
MTAQDINDLAVALHALLPTTTLSLAPWEAADQYRCADQLTAACAAAGIGDPEATVIADALAGYLGHWSSRWGNLDDEIEHAQQALVLALGNVVQPPMHTVVQGQEVTPQAIATMLSWVLLVDLEEDEG